MRPRARQRNVEVITPCFCLKPARTIGGDAIAKCCRDLLELTARICVSPVYSPLAFDHHSCRYHFLLPFSRELSMSAVFQYKNTNFSFLEKLRYRWQAYP